MALCELGVNIGPLIAGAGIVGIALGFGAQTLVRDFLSGLFMLFEDQYGIGDVVDLGDATGTVEAVTLRVTRLRDVNGTVWYVRNGEILRVGNMSQNWARTVLDVARRATARTSPEVRGILEETCHEHVGRRRTSASKSWRSRRSGASSGWTPTRVVVRVAIKTVPLEQWDGRPRAAQADQASGSAARASRSRSRSGGLAPRASPRRRRSRRTGRAPADRRRRRRLRPARTPPG